jgi:hypothetical protein
MVRENRWAMRQQQSMQISPPLHGQLFIASLSRNDSFQTHDHVINRLCVKHQKFVAPDLDEPRL